MDEVFKYRGRRLSADDIAGLRRLIGAHPQASRRKLSALVCEAWGWRQGNGALCDMVCRSLMLALHRAGHIQLPEKRCSPKNSLGAARNRPSTDFELDRSPVECGLAALGPLTIRRRNLHLAAYNTRFLVLPWVRVRHLASHVLGLAMRTISGHWQEAYSHPLYYLESFVDTERFAGTCYKAANWKLLGRTTGRGIKDKKNIVTLSLKDVLGYPLAKDFRERLCQGG